MTKPENIEDLAMMYFRWMRDERVQKDKAWQNYYEQCFLAVDKAYNTAQRFDRDRWQPLPGFYECLTCDEKQLREIVEEAGLGKPVESADFRTRGIWKYMATQNEVAIRRCKDKSYQTKAQYLNLPAESDAGADHKQKTAHIINFYLEGIILLRNIYRAIQTGESDPESVIPTQLGEVASPHVMRVKDEGKLELMFTALMGSLRGIDTSDGYTRLDISEEDLDKAGYPKAAPQQ